MEVAEKGRERKRGRRKASCNRCSCTLHGLCSPLPQGTLDCTYLPHKIKFDTLTMCHEMWSQLALYISEPLLWFLNCFLQLYWLWNMLLWKCHSWKYSRLFLGATGAVVGWHTVVEWAPEMFGLATPEMHLDYAWRKRRAADDNEKRKMKKWLRKINLT